MVAGVTLLVWFLGKMQLIPGLNELLRYAPVYYPPPIFIVALVTTFFIWSFARERNQAQLGTRCAIVTLLAVLTLTAYSFVLPLLTAVPLAQDDGRRIQIGFHMQLLSEEAQSAIERGKLLDPPKEYRTPNDLLYGFGVWGGEGEVGEIWPQWTIFASAAILFGVFIASAVLWAYALGALLRLLYSGETTDDISRRVQLIKGHFEYGPVLHIDRTVDADHLLADPNSTRSWARAISSQIQELKPEVVCGVSPSRARCAPQVAEELGAGLVYAEAGVGNQAGPCIQLSDSTCEAVRGKRLLIIEDITITAEAMTEVAAILQKCGAQLLGLASLVLIQDSKALTKSSSDLPHWTLCRVEANIWLPSSCPMCKDHHAIVEDLSIDGGKYAVRSVQVAVFKEGN